MKNKIPGSIYTRKTSRKLIIFLKGKQHHTGLDDTPENRKKAEKILYELYYELNDSSFQNKISIKNAVENYIEYCKQKKLSTKTLKGYIYSLKLIFHYDDNTNYLTEQIIEKTIKSFLALNQKKYSGTSMNIHLRSARAFLNYIQENENIEFKTNFYKKYRQKAARKEYMYYSLEEYELILADSRKYSERQTLLYEFLWETGFRIGETINLNRSQIDLERKVISIPNKINKKVIDYYPISKNVLEIIEKILKLVNSCKLFGYTTNQVSRLQKSLRNREKRLGIKKSGQSFHGFRKSFSKKLFDNDVSLSDVKDLMRHSDINTTLSYYKGYNTEKLRGVLNNLQ